jgi:hypothetical protein
MKGGSCRLDGLAGQRVINFHSDVDMLENMKFAIDVENAEATIPSDRTMIFDKILDFEGGVAGFNSRVSGVIVGALAACEHPALQCAACGDAAAMAVVRARPEEFFHVAAAGGFLAVMEGQAHKLVFVYYKIWKFLKLDMGIVMCMTTIRFEKLDRVFSRSCVNCCVIE